MLQFPAVLSLLGLVLTQATVRPDGGETSPRHAVVHAVAAAPAGETREASAPRARTSPLAWIAESVGAGRPDLVCRWFESLPAPERFAPELLAAVGSAAIEAEHPVLARTVYRRLRAADPSDARGTLGLARTYLLLDRPFEAVRYAELAVEQSPRDPDANECLTRALLLAGRFEDALHAVERALLTVDRSTGGLMSAHGSALFRLRRRSAAAAAYRAALRLDLLDAEANRRLGSGLAEASCAEPLPRVRECLERVTARDFTGAVDSLVGSLGASPGHPMGHRLLGEVLLAKRSRGSWILGDPQASELFGFTAELERLEAKTLHRFFPDYPRLSPARQVIVRRAAAVFWKDLTEVASIGGAHDFIPEDGRTTDSPRRAQLRGQRTFDGRLWDDVRGIGGLNAATGIEALDDPGNLCFDTLAHEVAHQVHLFAFSPEERAQIRELYQDACRSGRTLDYYARSNDAEYFAQGVEAFVSLAKRPGRQVTHGHTRLELFRRDPELHRFIARKVAHDPLKDRVEGPRLLESAVRFALMSGRSEDALAGASWLTGPRSEALRREAARCAALDRSY